MRLGKTCASTLAAAGGAGIALAFLVTGPDLRADQWLAILLALQILVFLTSACVWKTGHTLELEAWWVPVAALWLVLGVVQTTYSIIFFPDHNVAAHSSTWWWLVVDGIGYATLAVLVRELIFAELLEQFPPPPPGLGGEHGSEPAHG